MPFTPFHFGPGAALHAIAPRHVSFLSFCATNVLIDVETLYNIVRQRFPLHTFFHSYVGATLMIGIVVALFLAVRALARAARLPDLFGWQALTFRQVGIGAALGAYSHVVLDSIMHRDARPLAPFTDANTLLGAVPLGALHLSCVVAGVVGLAIVGLRAARSSTSSSGAHGKS